MKEVEIGDKFWVKEYGEVVVFHVTHNHIIIIDLLKIKHVINRDMIITEKEYLKHRLDEIEEEERKPIWPPESVVSSYVDQDGIFSTHDDTYAKSGSDQALSVNRSRQLYEKQRLMQDMYLWVDTFYPDWNPDWNDVTQLKCGINLKHGPDNLTTHASADACFIYDVLAFGISVPTEDAAKDMLKEFGERLQTWY